MDLQEQLIKLGVIDAPIKSICIGQWFDCVTIVFSGMSSDEEIKCMLKKCYEISLKHDPTYTKEMLGGCPCYKYYVQGIKILEEKGFVSFDILAWPLDGRVVCKEISIEVV